MIRDYELEGTRSPSWIASQKDSQLPHSTHWLRPPGGAATDSKPVENLEVFQCADLSAGLRPLTPRPLGPCWQLLQSRMADEAGYP